MGLIHNKSTLFWKNPVVVSFLCFSITKLKNVCPMITHFSFCIIGFSIIHKTFIGTLVESISCHPDVVISVSVLLSQCIQQALGLLTGWKVLKSSEVRVSPTSEVLRFALDPLNSKYEVLDKTCRFLTIASFLCVSPPPPPPPPPILGLL